jgi:catechol 2,3-dioxygenase-like lactoylglutathione lyase family enzyme|tara:strand:- start:361 stop:1203 length:843 start_codon:yes stop_codon:yes gene_type:complete
MFNQLDHLIVAVNDLQAAKNNYQKLFGLAPVWSGTHKELGTSNSLFNFQNTYFELLSPTSEGLGADLINHYLDTSGEGLIGMVFATKNIVGVHNALKGREFLVGDISDGEGINSADQRVRKWKNLFLPPELTRGIFSFVIEHTDGNLPEIKNLEASSPHKLDHVVINTNDADGFIEIYKDIFDIRLALDKTIEHWQKRMLFFRLNQTTIEVIEQQDDLPPSDKMWGLAWAVKDIEKAHQRLLDEGVKVTPIQKGVKEKTLVATIKSHTQNVPTLLIQHLD